MDENQDVEKNLTLDERVAVLEKEIDDIKKRLERLEKLVDELFVFIRAHV
ncbi:MAG: DUF5320 domain-containing protein [Crenarchaeota archaeon]|nr:DUF5320 domain-containing protein [Thermoproteota archaeon]